MSIKFKSLKGKTFKELLSILNEDKEIYYYLENYNQISSPEELKKHFDNNSKLFTPDTKCWVTMTDNFMSGWGKALNKINKLILECESIEEAQIVKSNAKKRSEMKYINIVYNKPYYNKENHYTSYHSKEDYPNWYKPNF